VFIRDTSSGKAHGLVCLGVQVHVAVVAYAVCCLDVMPLFYPNYHHHTTSVLWPFLWDHPGELVPEENLLDFMEQGKINRGRRTDHPAGRSSIWTNQCSPPPSLHLFYSDWFLINTNLDLVTNCMGIMLQLAC